MDPLEKKKLELEIKKLNRKWYNDIELYKTLIPTLGIIVTLYFTFGKGLLDSEKTSLEIQKETLKLEIVKFEQEKKDIQSSISISTEEQKALKYNLEVLDFKKDSLTSNIKKLEKINFDLNDRMKSESQEFAKSKEYYKKEINNIYNQQIKDANEILNRETQITKLREDTAELKVALSFFKSKYVPTRMEELELEAKKNKASILIYDDLITRSKEKIKLLKKERESKVLSIDTMSNDELIRLLELNLMKNK